MTAVSVPCCATDIETTRSDCGNASGRKTTAFAIAKSTHVPPIVSASVVIVASVKSGVRRNWRHP